MYATSFSSSSGDHSPFRSFAAAALPPLFAAAAHSGFLIAG
uniref:Uncharacterized protein n=1 Tax=Arundo donax TaxID=35708 RepID=A0A0A9FWX6_ARUDO